MAPFFKEYGNSSETTHEIRKVTADFMEYQLPDNGTKFDLLLCNQVVEHVPDPAAFTKKLIDSAKISIISVPYLWEDEELVPDHRSHLITTKMFAGWSEPHLPIYRGIVTEEGKRFTKRLIFVFKTD